jgi:arylsulfatase A-like enzyme
VVALMVCESILAVSANAAKQRPNILIIVTDDQRDSQTMPLMPKTRDWFGADGKRFKNGLVTTPTCCPSRSSIMTGRYVHNHGVLTNFDGDAQNLNQKTTLQYYLKRAGYQTALVGKYLNGWPLETAPPYFGRFAMAKGPRYHNADYNVNGVVKEISSYSTTFTRKISKRFLSSFEARDRKPWFLYLAVNAPHRPAAPQDIYKDAPVPPFRSTPAVEEEDRSDKPAYVQESPQRLAKSIDFRARQLRTLLSVDDLVHAVRRKLRRNREGHRTLAFFISDNGWLWDEHGLRGKGVPYLDALYVPFYMRWPGRVRQGVIDRRLAANIDIAPTVMEAAGLTPDNARMDGRSLLSGERRKRILTEMFGSLSHADLKWAATLSKSYEYVEYFGGEADRVTYKEYYDLDRDPWQLRNLLGDADSQNDPQKLHMLHRRLREDRLCAGRTCP